MKRSPRRPVDMHPETLSLAVQKLHTGALFGDEESQPTMLTPRGDQYYLLAIGALEQAQRFAALAALEKEPSKEGFPYNDPGNRDVRGDSELSPTHTKKLSLRVTYNGKVEDYDYKGEGLGDFPFIAPEFFAAKEVSLVRLGWWRFEKSDPVDGAFIEVARKEREFGA